MTSRTKQTVFWEPAMTVSQLGGLQTMRATLFRSFTKHFATVAADTSPAGMEELTESLQTSSQ